MSDHPLNHQPRKFRSISAPGLIGRVYDHKWQIRFLDILGIEIFRLDPYVLHGPDRRDNGLAEIKEVARKTRKENPTLPIHSVKISYLGVL